MDIFSQALARWLVCSDTRLIIGKSIYLTMNTGDCPEITYMTRNVIAEIDSLYYAYIITIAMDAAMSYRYKKELHRFNYHFVEPLRRIQVRAFIAFAFTFLIMRVLFLKVCIHIAAFIDIVMLK